MISQTPRSTVNNLAMAEASENGFVTEQGVHDGSPGSRKRGGVTGLRCGDRRPSQRKTPKPNSLNTCCPGSRYNASNVGPPPGVRQRRSPASIVSSFCTIVVEHKGIWKLVANGPVLSSPDTVRHDSSVEKRAWSVLTFSYVVSTKVSRRVTLLVLLTSPTGEQMNDLDRCPK